MTKLAPFVAAQLARPSGIVGRIVLPRLFNRRNAALNDLTFECLALRPHDRVVEVGFGGGYLLERAGAAVVAGEVAGVDASPEMAAFCGRRYRSRVQTGRLRISCAKAEALPYPSAYFTRACTVNTIFYWQDAGRAIEELWRVLATGSIAVICFTSRECIQDRPFSPYGLTVYTSAEVETLMATVGFRQITVDRGTDRQRAFLCVTGRKENVCYAEYK